MLKEFLKETGDEVLGTSIEVKGVAFANKKIQATIY